MALALGVMSSPRRGGRCPPTGWASSPNGWFEFPQRENGCIVSEGRIPLVELVIKQLLTYFIIVVFAAEIEVCRGDFGIMRYA